MFIFSRKINNVRLIVNITFVNVVYVNVYVCKETTSITKYVVII